MVNYLDSVAEVTAERLHGFFVGWPNPPAPAAHLRILQGSDHVVLAQDAESGNIVGFVTAISDGVSIAYIPYLEVLPPWEGRGIGTELMQRMLHALRDLYAVDLTCDADVQPFYARLGMRPSTGMIQRNYARQSCE